MTDFLECDMSRLSENEACLLYNLIMKSWGVNTDLLWTLFMDELRKLPDAAPGEKADVIGLTSRAWERYGKVKTLLEGTQEGKDSHAKPGKRQARRA